MFGTTALMKPLPGKEDAVVKHFDFWWRQRAPKVPGILMGSMYRNVSNPSELILTVVFSSRSSYEDNANDPEQDSWYRDLVPLLDGEPQWIDGDVLSVHSRGAL